MKICVAGAGAGKTTAMAQKIANACNSLGPQKNIYCLSFTNAAVNHIKEKLLEYYAEVPPNIMGMHTSLISLSGNNKTVLFPFIWETI